MLFYTSKTFDFIEYLYILLIFFKKLRTPKHIKYYG